jgi:hypothetical protein
MIKRQPNAAVLKRSSTVFLKTVVIFLGFVVLALCVVGIPIAIQNESTGMYRPILLAMYVPALPFFYALYQAIKLLGYIEKNKVFTRASVATMRAIKYCGFIISGFYALGMPYVYHVANKDDAPGVILIGLTIIFTAFVIAVFAAVLQKLLQGAVDIKAENDLTV